MTDIVVIEKPKTIVVNVPEQGPPGAGAPPSATVESEETYGQTPDLGTDDTFSRGDHTHGTPPAQTADEFNHDDTSNITGTAGQYNHPNDAKVLEITHDNRANLDTVDQDLAKTNTPEFRAGKLTKGLTNPAYDESTFFYDDERKCIGLYIDEAEFTWQVGREFPMRVFNNTAGTLLNGRAARVAGVGTGGGTFVLPYIDYATAHFANAVAPTTIGIITHDIEAGTFGEVTILGWVNDINTSAPLVSGQTAWLAASDPADGTMTAVKPSSPDYAMNMGGCLVSDASVGVLWSNYLPTGNKHDVFKFFNGAILEEHTVDVDSDGATITLTLDDGGDTLSMFFDAEFFEITIPATVALTPGTDTVPLLNFVFIPESTKVLTANITSFPTTGQYVPVATVLCQTAATTAANEVLKLHAWTDHLASDQDQGHLADINKWIRTQNATWLSGGANTYTVNGIVDTSISTTSIANVLQLHAHTFPIFADPATFFVQNDSVTPYTTSINLADILLDSEGVTLLNRKFGLVLWGCVSEHDDQCKLFINLPSGSYLSLDGAITDTSKFTNYSIPEEYRGTGFLIHRFICTWDAPGNNFTVTPSAGDELRGTFPNTVAGGSSPSGDFDASGTAQAIMDLHTDSEAPPATYDHSTFLTPVVGGIERDTDPYANGAATTITFLNMYDNATYADDHNVAIWTFGTGTIAAAGITLFAAPAAGNERYGVIKIDFTNPPLFAVGAWPAGKNLTAGGTEPIFDAGTKYAEVFITKNDLGIQYKVIEWVA